MHIQATRSFWYAGAVVRVGTVLALPTVLAAELVHNGKAQACAAPAATPAPDTPVTTPAPDTPAATPATPAAKAKAKAADKATSPKPLEATP